MTKFRVFVGAPPQNALQQQDSAYRWQTVSSMPSQPSVILPSVTLEAASRRISLLYQNIIFHVDDEEGGISHHESDDDVSIGQQSSAHSSTIISWLPTDPRGGSFLQQSFGPTISFLDTSVSRYQLTQDTQGTSFDYSDSSSIAQFPAFHFNLHTLTSLSSLAINRVTHKISVLLATLEVEGPDSIRIKKGADAGKEVSILKMIMGDADGQLCKLTAWREVAEAWGGGGKSPAVKRGDVVWIENVRASYEPSTAITLTASPFLHSSLQICYRTMPYTHEDSRLRPDLRLGTSDATVKKIEALVKWFEDMAGLGS